MKNPKEIQEIIPGATYSIPVYKVTDNGLEDSHDDTIQFCKGNKNDSNVFRQEGVFTETIIYVAKRYLESVNVGELCSNETTIAIQKLDEALMWLNKRAEDRKLRNVQGSYEK